MQRMDPFIMLDYNAPVYFPPSEIPRGVDVHPHRGFETVTIAYKGRVEHHDSSGGGGIIGEGDVQWMTAASGVLHKEFHEKAWSKEGGYFQMVQLWVNLPAQFKMSAPKYQAISNNLMNKFVLENNIGTVEVIAGKYKDVLGSASTFSPIHVFNAKLKSGATVPFQFPSQFNTALLVIEGTITIQEQSVPVNHFVLMANDAEAFSITASEDCIVLVLSGEPIQEPIAAHGPFVMNTREELKQAFDDYQQGKFGSL
jgi:redox-sensitive bicupin YhaK (pirin superfamily)